MPRLSKALIDSLPAGAEVYDTRTEGLGVRAFGKHSVFVFRYSFAGKRRRVKLGRTDGFGLEEARAMAINALGALARGVDPFAPVETPRDTVAELAAAWLAHATAHGKKTVAADRARLRLYVLPALGSTRVCELTIAAVAKMHHHIGAELGKRTEANRVRALVSVMVNKARMLGFEPPAVHPCEGVERFREVKRDRFVTPDEMPRLLAALATESPTVRAAIWLYLLTGLRKTELLRLRWSDIDFNRNTLTLGETKAGRPHTEPLSSAAVDVLRSLPRDDASPYVFPARQWTSRSGHFVGIRKPWDRIRKAAQLEDVRLHDLRRTVGSWLAMSGESLPIIGKVLNHSRSSTTEVYARLTEHPARAALERLGAMLKEVEQ